MRLWIKVTTYRLSCMRYKTSLANYTLTSVNSNHSFSLPSHSFSPDGRSSWHSSTIHVQVKSKYSTSFVNEFWVAIRAEDSDTVTDSFIKTQVIIHLSYHCIISKYACQRSNNFGNFLLNSTTGSHNSRKNVSHQMKWEGTERRQEKGKPLQSQSLNVRWRIFLLYE